MITIEQNESSELETFKHKVWQVANRYAALYDWYSVVEEVLNELGVNEPEQISINIKTQIGTIDARWKFMSDEGRVRHYVPNVSFIA